MGKNHTVFKSCQKAFPLATPQSNQDSVLLAEGQPKRPMEQNREPRNRTIRICPTDFLKQTLFFRTVLIQRKISGQSKEFLYTLYSVPLVTNIICQDGTFVTVRKPRLITFSLTNSNSVLRFPQFLVVTFPWLFLAMAVSQIFLVFHSLCRFEEYGSYILQDVTKLQFV